MLELVNCFKGITCTRGPQQLIVLGAKIMVSQVCDSHAHVTLTQTLKQFRRKHTLLAVVLAMAQLAALVEADLAKINAKDKVDKQRPRLVADPSIGVGDLVSAVRNFCMFKGTSDLALIVSPNNGRTLAWKSRPDAEFMVKLAGLCYDLAVLAPNSKLPSKKLRQALAQLLLQGDIRNMTQKENNSFLDLGDLTIRIAMAQFRTCKQDLQQREIVMKRLQKSDQAKISHVLQRLQLPDQCTASDSEGEGEVDTWVPARKDYKGSNKAQIHESQAIVPFKPVDCPLPSRLDQDPDLLDLEDPSLSAFAKVLNGKAFDAEPTADTRKNITKRPSLVGLRMSDSSPESVKNARPTPTVANLRLPSLRTC